MHTHRFRLRPSRPRLRLLAAVGALAGVALSLTSTVATSPTAGAQTTPSGWYIDANSLLVRNADEDSCYIPTPFGCAVESDGDEPMFAVVAFRTRLGVPGSTQAWVVNSGGFDELCTNAEEGDTCAIPDATGRAHFGYVSRPTIAEMVAGARPDLIGTIQVAVEDDGTPNSTMNTILNRLRNATRAELAAASESVTAADLANLGGVASRFSSIGDRIRNRIEIDWLDKLAIWGISGGDTDLVLDPRVTVMVGVDRSLQSQVDLALYAALHGSDIAAAVLHTRSMTLPHREEGVHYDVSQVIRYMPAPL